MSEHQKFYNRYLRTLFSLVPHNVRLLAVGYAGTGGGQVVATIDGGTTWTDESLPSDVYVANGVTCPTISDCWAVGSVGTSGSFASAVIATTDAGATWAPESLPSNVSGGLEALSCPTTSDCWAITGNGNQVVATDQQRRDLECTDPAERHPIHRIGIVLDVLDLRARSEVPVSLRSSSLPMPVAPGPTKAYPPTTTSTPLRVPTRRTVGQWGSRKMTQVKRWVRLLPPPMVALRGLPRYLCQAGSGLSVPCRAPQRLTAGRWDIALTIVIRGLSSPPSTVVLIGAIKACRSSEASTLCHVPRRPTVGQLVQVRL